MQKREYLAWELLRLIEDEFPDLVDPDEDSSIDPRDLLFRVADVISEFKKAQL
jgi:hypothetical protein